LKASAIILGAGNSQRMGVYKPFLQFDSSHTFLEQIVDIYQTAGVDEIIVVVNTMFAKENLRQPLNLPDNAKLILNEHPEFERFYSLKLAVNAKTSSFPFFLQNVDNPFVSKKILNELMANFIDCDYCVPCFNGQGGHPVLLKNILCDKIKSEPSNQIKLNGFLQNFKRKNINVDNSEILINLNTPEIYKEMFGK